MESKKEQINLFRMRNEIKQSLSSIRVGKDRYLYLKRFLRRNKILLFYAISFLLLQTIIEIFLLVLVNNTIGSIFVDFSNKSHSLLAITILVFCLVYTFISFFAVRYERKLVLTLINDLRREAFSLNLSKDTIDNNFRNRSDFIAKTSYHFSLLTMGIDNTLLSGIRWLLYFIVLLILTYVNKGFYLSLTGGIFIASILLFFAFYFVSKKYISRQIASYSKIIKHIANSMLEIPLIKNFHREFITKKNLDRIVDIDTHFRIIRDTWIRYSGRVVFILIIAAGAGYFLIASYYPVLEFNKLNQVFVKGIFYIYAVRALYSISKAGLYLLPLRLGIFLSIPEYSIKNIKPRKNWNFKTINFKSNKIKLFKEGSYYKNISLEFSKGGRYLFYGDYRIGKTHLAALIAGQGYFSRHSWVVKVDSERLSYNVWSEIFHDSYMFNMNFYSDASVGEVILGKEREDIEESDISKINNLALKHPVFLSVFSKTRFTGESIRLYASSPVSLFTIQAAYCILNRPKVIVIDNSFIDLKYKQIEDLLKILESELPESIIIIFSREKNSIINYSSTYEMEQSTIK